MGFSKGVGHSFPPLWEGDFPAVVDHWSRGTAAAWESSEADPPALARERGRGALVVELDRNRHDGLPALGEGARRARLVGSPPRSYGSDVTRSAPVAATTA